MTTATAALLLPFAAGVATAQDAGSSAGFAIEVPPPVDIYSSTRVGVRVNSPVSEPASTFVRGCRGTVMAEGDGVPFEVTDRMLQLVFTAAGDGLESLVLATPDGLYQCALANDMGFITSTLASAPAGRYTVWLGAAEGSEIAARLFASSAPVSSLELFGLDPARLGEPRAGRFVYTATADTGRQELARGATVFAETPMDPISREYCAGYSRFDAADAVLTLDAAQDRFSVFAMSDRDLTIAVVDPAGNVSCNDDSFQLNPAVTFSNAAAGDYQIFVGAYSPGGNATYDLFTSQGAPAFLNTAVNLEAEPIAGRGVFDVTVAGNGQHLASSMLNAVDPMEALPTGSYCPGFTDASAPSYALTLDQSLPMMSIYAASNLDLVLAVRAPDGSWSCNDDSFELNPGVSFSNAQPGEYLAFVGTYGSGIPGSYDLFASVGAPNWEAVTGGAVPGGMPGGFPGTMPGSVPSLNTAIDPAVGHVAFGPSTRVDPRLIFDINASNTEAFALGNGCAGFITPAQPDVVVDVEEGLPQLMIYMVSEADGTLVIAGPDGQLHCNDDFEGLNPGVLIENPTPGAYSVFAGTYSGNGGPATLGVTLASPTWVMDREH